MASKQTYLTLDIPVRSADAGVRRAYRVTVYHSPGGLNVWSHGTDERGIWVSCGPVEFDGDFVRFKLGDGRRTLAEPLSRRNDRRGRAVAEELQTQLLLQAAAGGPAGGRLTDFVRRVMADSGFTLERCGDGLVAAPLAGAAS